MNKRALKKALKQSIPILCSYVFISMAYGMLMAENGYPWYVALLASVIVYTGAFQFVLVSLLAGGASLGLVAVTALLMNSRQTFYSLSFVSDFRAMGRRMPYMVYTMTDESYAVNCSLERDDPDRQDAMFYVAILCRIYWLLGTVLGAVVGQSLPFDLTGIDFCMTVCHPADGSVGASGAPQACAGGRGHCHDLPADFWQRQLYAACAADNLRRVGDP